MLTFFIYVRTVRIYYSKKKFEYIFCSLFTLFHLLMASWLKPVIQLIKLKWPCTTKKNVKYWKDNYQKYTMPLLPVSVTNDLSFCFKKLFTHKFAFFKEDHLMILNFDPLLIRFIWIIRRNSRSSVRYLVTFFLLSVYLHSFKNT